MARCVRATVWLSLAGCLGLGCTRMPPRRAAPVLPGPAQIELATSPAERLAQAAAAAKVPWPLTEVNVVVHKADRLVELRSGQTVVQSYPAALGYSPKGDKEREGDGRTPEGDFYVCTRLAKSRFHRFLGLSYPAADDARTGLAAGVITEGQYRSIRRALDHGDKPPWDTPLGGEIGIHGGGAERDWTHGCIAISDEAIEELFEVCALGTPVTIEP